MPRKLIINGNGSKNYTLWVYYSEFHVLDIGQV